MNSVLDALPKIKSSLRILSHLDVHVKNKVLQQIKSALIENKSEILKANVKDIAALTSHTTKAFIDRLQLTDSRIGAICESVDQIAQLPDPIGETTESKILSNGLKLRRVRSPLGVIFLIFESRPNVVIESFALSFKAGNACILRGGKESIRTCTKLYEIIETALSEAGLSPFSCFGIKNADRTILETLLKQRKFIDVVIPRGGDSLMDYVVKNSQIPIIKNDRGLCHVYVHEDADLKMACEIVMNAKTQRPGVCNAMETLLVHSKIANQFLPKLYTEISKTHSVEIYGCESTLQILPGIKVVDSNSFDTEYLDYKMNCKVVTSLEEAIEHISAHGSNHSETIITASQNSAKRFQNEVDAAAVYWNASTRFTDGFEFGLGGEIGISTQKLHVRGPVGLKELTSLRWIIDGNGQIRK